MVFEVDLTECGENGGADFENGCGDWVADHEMALVVKGLRKCIVVDEGIPRRETAGGCRNDGVIVGEQFMTAGSLLALFDLHLEVDWTKKVPEKWSRRWR
jgi:hypothetical protein